MAAEPYIFPGQQADFLRALRDGRYRPPVRNSDMPCACSLVSEMPPIYEQALRGTCVSNAVTALLEYYEDCKTRLSVQYLFAATKELEKSGLERNLKRLRSGEALDAEFEQLHHKKLLQLRMMADANGGMDSPVMRPYLMQFEETVRTRYDSMDGSLLQSCFHVIETRGVCRYALWPYAGASATPLFGTGGRITFPPGADEDAKKHRVNSGVYLLPAPNNVDEIRGILAGCNNRRPMPVCVTLSFFSGCDGETFAFPRTEETEAGLAAVDDRLGVHGMLIVGYKDDASYLGGGYFIVRNSLGESWGEKGYGKLPYAYAACFALEAGTVLQDIVDYAGDGYGGMRQSGRGIASRENRVAARIFSRKRFILVNSVIAVLLISGTWFMAAFFLKRERVHPSGAFRPPFVEITVYGRSDVSKITLPPPLDGEKGRKIDGGRVFRLPAKTRKDVNRIREILEAHPTLREKRGKPFTYDLVTFYDLKSDDTENLKKTIGLFAAEGFPVWVEGESDGFLRISTLSPYGFRGRLEKEYNIHVSRRGCLTLKSRRSRVRRMQVDFKDSNNTINKSGENK